MFKYILLGLIIFAGSCKMKNESKDQEAKALIKEIETTLIPLNIEVNKLWYEAATTGSDSAYKKSAELVIAQSHFFANKIFFQKLKSLKESGLLSDSIVKREVDVYYLQFLGHQADTALQAEIVKMQTAIEQKYTSFRAELNGKKLSDNDVDSILKNSVNPAELETTWKGSKKIGQLVAPDIINLVKKRNELAKSMGFANYHHMSLKLSEQDPSEIERLFNELDTLTRAGFVKLKGEIDAFLVKRFSTAADKLMPWYYQNRFFQEAPAIYSVELDTYYKKADILKSAESYYNGIGLPVDDIIAHSDIYEKPGKNQHAFCSDIDHTGDVRVLLNIRNDAYWMGTVLHELGHGVYAKYNDSNLPYLLRDAAHTLTTEAIAMMFGRFYSSPSWLLENIGISESEASKIQADCSNTLRLEQLVFSRWAQVMFRFEKAMYANPDQDLNKLWWDLVEKYQMIKRPEGRNEPDWASKIHIATAPCYYHNYLMGELLASQLYYTITEGVLKSVPGKESFSGKPEAGKFLVDKVFHPGMRYPWNDMIERATGEKLTAKYYARQFVY